MAETLMALLVSVGVDTSAFQKGITGAEKSTRSFGKGIESLIPPSVSRFLTLSGAVASVGVAIESVVSKTSALANSVRQISSLSGASSEDASRFVQLLDDYKLSAEDALLATRALTKEGYVPSIETLAELSDQYLKLGSVEEKNEFILKNLGKGGLKWVEVLNKGSKALREQGAAISKNLILSKEQVDNVRKMEISQDVFNDKLQEFQLILGNEIIPLLTDVIDSWTGWIRVIELAQVAGEDGKFTLTEFAAAFRQAHAEQEANTASLLANAEATNAAGDAIDNEVLSLEELEKQAKAAQDALDAISEVNVDFLGKVQDMQQFLDDYAERHKELTDEQARLTEELQKANEEFGRNSEEVQNATTKLDENRQAVKELELEYYDFMTRFASELVWERLKGGVEGLTDAELEAGLQMDMTAGLIDQATVDMVNNMMEVADAAVESAHRIEQAAAAAGKFKQAAAGTSARSDDSTTTTTPSTGGRRKHAQGGSFMVPSQFGYEGFDMGGIATASGGELVTITPRGGGGGKDVNISVVVNNPVKETAEESVRRELKSLSFTGVFTE